MTRGTSKTTRLRKVACHECEYIVRISRSCMARGLPICPVCREEMTADDPADMIELGLLSLDDLSRPIRTEVCRRMGWDDEIIRTNRAQGVSPFLKTATAMPF